MKTVAYTSAARRQFKKLEKAVQEQVSETVAAYAETGVGDVLKLKGRENAYRLRSGNYRVVFTLDGDTMTIEAVGDRKDIYE